MSVVSPSSKDDQSKGTAIPVASAVGSGNIIVQAVGSGINVAVSPQVPHLRLTLFDARTERVKQERSDAALLSAYRSDVVPLLGRENVLGDLWAWMERDATVCIRVLVGAGGRGKTRLGLELARQALAKRWLAGFIEQGEMDRFRRQQNVSDWGWDKPTLLIVDYAASRVEQLRDWLGELVDAGTSRPPLRMLLLERQAERKLGWMASVFGHGENDRSRAALTLLDPVEPVELAAVSRVELRREIFATLLARKREGLVAPEAGTDPDFDRLLAGEQWAGDPLLLMMAGLVAGEVGVKHALALSRADLAEKVARRELYRIGAIAAANGIDRSNQTQKGAFGRHVAALATLTQGLSLTDARKLVDDERQRLGSSADTNSVLAALRDALPGSEGRDISPIQPDIVGEAAILVWAAELAWIGVEASASIKAGRDEPIRWLGALTHTLDADAAALMLISYQLPQKTVVLREFAADLAQRISDRVRTNIATADAKAADYELLAEWLTTLAFRLDDLGRLEEALAAAEQAVEIHTQLAEARSGILPADSVRSISSLATILRRLGRAEEALDAAQWVVDVYRQLAAEHADMFRHYIAGSLTYLGDILSDLDRREEAVAAIQQGVDIYRELAAERPDVFGPDLAASLNNLTARLRVLGRHAQALPSATEAVHRYRDLAAAWPDTFRSDLAGSLVNLGNVLNELGRHEEALATAREAVNSYRQLAVGQFDTVRRDLATALTVLGAMESYLGRAEEALAAAQEAAHIWRELAAERPDAYRRELARSLNNLGPFLRLVGRPEEALGHAQEAVDIYRKLAADRPDVFRRDVATALNNLGNVLSDLGRAEEALATAQEAVDRYREVAAGQPDADLATSLNNLAARLRNLGRTKDALAAAQEEVAIYRKLSDRRPDVFRPRLATSLTNLGAILHELGRA
jgi:tetratricopeptide (TPR) repeat protein